MTLITRMPAIFIGHGSPMNAIEDNAWSRSWRQLGESLPRPRAILCISAHWETHGGVSVASAAKPGTIHDFSGFPRPLFEIQYPAPGSPELARRVIELLRPLADVSANPTYGLDHGSWCPLRRMYPQAEVPVLQLSLQRGRPGSFHYGLGRGLSALRDEGVMILGSGNVVHNLGAIDFRQRDGHDWADRIDRAVRDRMRSGQHEALVDYERLDPQMRLAVPTPEHYWPLLYVLGAQRPDDGVRLFNEGTTMGSIAMTSVVLGG